MQPCKFTCCAPQNCGFSHSHYFEAGWGDPSTPKPYVTITPSFVGNSLLPFRCPNCKRPAQELACPKTRKKYHDQREGRDNYYCPECGYRFKIDLAGTPLASTLKAGATVGPSKITRGGKTSWQDRPGILGTVLGAMLPLRGAGSYEALAQR